MLIDCFSEGFEVGKKVQKMVKADRIEELEEQIAALKRQWPAHSVPPSLLQRLDDLEDELELERKKVVEDKKDA